MPTIFAHALVGYTMAKACAAGPRTARWAALLAMLPDADVIAWPLTGFDGLLAHRGLTHSLAFALLCGIGIALLLNRAPAQSRFAPVAGLLAASTASHGLLDAATNGGSGIAFLAPFSGERWFLPWTPIEVSPLGAGFFSWRGLEVLANELLWLGLPCCVILALTWGLQRRHES